MGNVLQVNFAYAAGPLAWSVVAFRCVRPQHCSETPPYACTLYEALEVMQGKIAHSKSASIKGGGLAT